MTAAKITGTPKVVILKARPRTCSRYSRFATSQILRIDFASDRLDKDFLERRLDHFEAIDPRAGGSFVQQFLSVAVLLEADLGVAGEILRLGDLGALQEVGVAFEFH